MSPYRRAVGVLGCLLVALAVLVPGITPSASARAASGAATATKSGVFKVCKGQTYALCAVASCFVFNGLAYCTCDVEHGDSISLPFTYDRNKDVCSVNAEGASNGYMVSTFSLADSIVAPSGDKAIYTCPGRTSSGAYAQCDGGICFRSTQGQHFPGSTKPLARNQIICSCPVTVPHPPEAIGHQIAGPYPCRRGFFANCNQKVANTDTGSTVYVGAPTGTATLLTRLLYGSVPAINRCPSPEAATAP